MRFESRDRAKAEGRGDLWLDDGEWLESGAPLLLHQVAVVVDVQLRNGRSDLVLLVDPDNLQPQK